MAPQLRVVLNIARSRLRAAVSVGSLFRLIAYSVPSAEAAAAAPGPFVALQLAFAGFLVSPAHMGTAVKGTGWMVFLFYTSVFAYGARSMAHNEFFAPAYNVFPASNYTLAALTPGGTLIREEGSPITTPYFPADVCAATPELGCGRDSYGVLVMRALNIATIGAWKWGGVGFLGFFVLFMNRSSAAVAAKKAYQIGSLSIGSSRVPDEAEEAEQAAVVEVPTSATSVLPFQPMTVAWRDLSYTVQIPRDLGGGERKLLHEISGLAQPGHLMALMGASGAGKTTLLDVIACRKTHGTITGEIFLNGFPTDPAAFARLTAYCEQMDVHSDLSTVRESLAFSAALRLPATATPETRRAFVDEVADVLELRPLMGRMVGQVGESDSLAPGQRKLLTIAVELVSNALIIFLDEPTSGLDSRAAVMVMRVVRRIATSQRTVISTIHQPSAEVFFLFDDMLLLQRGGWMAYHGALGRAGACLVSYLEGLPDAHSCPVGMNPASWMLDVLARTDSSAEGAAGAATSGEMIPGPELAERLQASGAWKESLPAFTAACEPLPGAKPFAFSSRYARFFVFQCGIVAARLWQTYDRNLGYVLARTKTLLFLNTLYGIVFYKVQQAVDCAPAQHVDEFRCIDDYTGMQAIVSVVFLSCLFVAVVHMGAGLPFLFRIRSVFYRERLSYMYQPEAHSLSILLVELPWMLLTVFITVTPLYFMAGFTPAASSYFFYMFVVSLNVMVFLSLGMVMAHAAPSVAVAGAVQSSFLPLVSLFAGVYIPAPQIPWGPDSGHGNLYLKWVYYANPVAHAVNALAPARFYDAGRPSTVDHKIKVPVGTGTLEVDAYKFYMRLHGTGYEARWHSVGYMFVFIGGLQVLQFYYVRFRIHASR